MALEGLFTGLAQGVDSGMRIGLLARQIRAEENRQQLEQQKIDIADKKEAMKAKYESYEKVTNQFKATPKPNRELFWNNVVRPTTKDTFGYDPGDYGEGKGDYLDAFGDLIQAGKKGPSKGGMTWDDVFVQAGWLRTQMDKDQSTQAGDILKDLPEFKAATDKPKKMAPEDAAKRWTELQTSLTKMGKLTDLQSIMVTANPDLAKDKGFMSSITFNPEDIGKMQGAALNEMKVIAPNLPPNLRPQFVTSAEYQKAKAELSVRKGRPISDSEMYSIMMPVDNNAGQ